MKESEEHEADSERMRREKSELATGRKKWDLSHFSSTALFILLHVGVGMFVCEHLQAQSYRHMIGLDDVARRLHRWVQ